MEQVTQPTQEILNLIVQVILIVVPILITWFIRTYVRGSTAERDIAAITRLSNAAIDYAENLDKRGDLLLPPDISKGAHKLKLAAGWLESELKRAGINMTDAEAQQWISAEFQKRVGDVRMTSKLAELARTAVEVILSLEQRRALQLPSDVDRIAYLSELAADWVVAQYAIQRASITREEAITWVRAELLQKLQVSGHELPSSTQLAELAIQAVAFLEGLKMRGQLAVRPSGPGGNVELDVATAWLLTEAAKQGLTVTSDQIVEAIAVAFRR